MNRLILAGLMLCLVAAPSTLAQAPAAPQPGPAPAVQPPQSTPSQTNLPPPPPAGALGFVVVYLGVVLIIAAAPMIVDVIQTHRTRKATLAKLVELAGQPQLDDKELERLIEALGRQPGGMKGIARTSMALAVIAVIGIAVFHVLVFYRSPSGEVPPVLTSVLSILGGLVASVTGFYFGGRAAGEASEKKPEQPPAPGQGK